MSSFVRLARGVLPAVAVAAALLVVTPGLEAPFSTPKRWVLLGAAALALALLPWSRRRVAWPLALLPAAALVTLPFALGSAPEPTGTWLAFSVLAFAWASGGVDARWLASSLVSSGALVAVVALAQAAGVDPFAALVPHADGERLRVYSTLGNPDFVASALTVVLCLAVAQAAEAARRVPWLLGAALVLLGLAVTRSFGTVASLGAALVVGALHLARSGAARARVAAVGSAMASDGAGSTYGDRQPARSTVAAGTDDAGASPAPDASDDDKQPARSTVTAGTGGTSASRDAGATDGEAKSARSTAAAGPGDARTSRERAVSDGDPRSAPSTVARISGDASDSRDADATVGDAMSARSTGPAGPGDAGATESDATPVRSTGPAGTGDAGASRYFGESDGDGNPARSTVAKSTGDASASRDAGGDRKSVRSAAGGTRGEPARSTARARMRWLVLPAVGALAVLLLPLAGRSFSDAAEGRLYLTRVIAPHALDAPLSGLGPGAVEALWPAWEVEWWRARCGDDAACVAADPRSRFAALQDHAHDDWLEVLVERGLLGLASLLVLFAFALRRAWRSPRVLGTGVVAALVAMMTRAALDFPLARPADLCLLAAVVGLASHLEEP